MSTRVSNSERVPVVSWQMAADYLLLSDAKKLSRVCVLFFRALRDKVIVENLNTFKNLSGTVLLRRAVMSRRSNGVGGFAPFAFACGFNNATRWYPDPRSPFNLIMTDSRRLHIFKGRDHAQSLNDIVWVGRTSLRALVWKRAEMQMVSIDLQTGIPEAPLEFEIDTERFKKLSVEDAEKEKEKVKRKFCDQSKFFLQEDGQLYLLANVMLDQSAHLLRVFDRKVVLMQSTDLVFNRSANVVTSPRVTPSSGKFSIYISDEYALTCDNGIEKNKVSKDKRSRKAMPNLFEVEEASTRTLTAYALTDTGRKKQWTQTLTGFEVQWKPNSKNSKQKVRDPDNHFIQTDEDFVAVASQRANATKEEPFHLEVYEIGTGKPVFPKLDIRMSNLMALTIQRGILGAFHSGTVTLWDLKGRVSLGCLRYDSGNRGNNTLGMLTTVGNEIRVFSVYTTRLSNMGYMDFFNSSNYVSPEPNSLLEFSEPTSKSGKRLK